tara:strand:- start:19 stop:270 length:252 start_codon:yes stop_codon:yes gene_type:complete
MNDILINKARFKARRGLNELDKIFVPFVENRFLSLDAEDQTKFLEFLELDDTYLADLLIYKTDDCPEKFIEIFIKISKFFSEI